ncbi:hypothetical protein [Pseudothermotoga sp.]
MVVRIDENGELIWAKCLGTLIDDVVYAVSFDCETYYLAGVSYSRSLSDPALTVRKMP